MIFRKAREDDLTVVEMLAAALRRDIAFGVHAPDQKLKIEDLRRRYGGSNHSMRETLRLLSAEGLVEATAQRGFRVTSATAHDLRDIALVRSEIECIAMTRAMHRGDFAWEGRVVATHHGLQQTEAALAAAPDDLAALEWDRACFGFARALVDACDSPRLLDLHRRLFDQSRRARLARMREGRLDWAARKNRQDALLAAVLARETDRAAGLLRDDIEDELATT
ncbi:MAG: GntR family transcriptional regulator [Pseudomonadota bacterium]